MKTVQVNSSAQWFHRRLFLFTFFISSCVSLIPGTSWTPCLAGEKEDYLTAVMNRIMIKTESVYQDFSKLLQQSFTRADVRQQHYDTFVWDINTKAQELYLNIEKLLDNEDLEDFGFHAKKDMAKSVIDGVFENDFNAEKFFRKIVTHHEKNRAIDSQFLQKKASKQEGDTEITIKLNTLASQYQDSQSVSQTDETKRDSIKKKSRCSDCKKRLTSTAAQYHCETCESTFCKTFEFQAHFVRSMKCAEERIKQNRDRLKGNNPVVIADKVKDRV